MIFLRRKFDEEEEKEEEKEKEEGEEGKRGKKRHCSVMITKLLSAKCHFGAL